MNAQLVNYSIKVGILFTLVLLCHRISICQSIEYEIQIKDDSLDIRMGKFIRGHSGSAIGIVLKAPIYDSIQQYSSFVYYISKNGDTTSKHFKKQDTVFAYNELTLVLDDPPGYYLVGNGYKINTNPQDEMLTIFTRVDSNFNVLWEAVYSFDYWYYGYRYNVLTLEDGSLLYCCSPGAIKEHFLFHISENGDSLNYKHYQGIEAGTIWGLSYSPDSSSYWLNTQFAYYNSGYGSCSRIVIDSNLNQFDYSFYPDWLMPPYSVKNYDHNSVLLCGSTELTIPPNTEDYYISNYYLDENLEVINENLLTRKY